MSIQMQSEIEQLNSELEESDDPQPATGEHELAVVGPLAHRHELVGDGETLLGRFRSPERHPARSQDRGEVARVVQLPREGDGLIAQREAAFEVPKSF